MAVAIGGRLRQGWRAVVRQKFWVLVGLAIVAGMIGDAWVREWWPQAISFLAVCWPWLLIGAAAAAAVWWVWWRLPKHQAERLKFAIRDPKARTDVEDNFRKTIGQMLGGIAVLIGAGFAYLQFTQQQQVLISNQVGKGFELLGNEKKNRRAAARRHLCAGGRDERLRAIPSAGRWGFVLLRPGRDADENRRRYSATEIQAALTVIGRRKEGAGRCDLHGAHIPKAVLSGADLSDAYLSGVFLGHANLTDANLFGAELFGADLSGAYLSGADLSGAPLSGANLKGAFLGYANLSGAYLGVAARLNNSGIVETLSGSNLSGADLSGVRHLTQEQLDGACGNENTKLDPPLKIKPCPPDQPAAGSSK